MEGEGERSVEGRTEGYLERVLAVFFEGISSECVCAVGVRGGHEVSVKDEVEFYPLEYVLTGWKTTKRVSCKNRIRISG